MGDCVDKSGGLVVDISGRMGGGQVGLDVYTCLILIHYATSQIKWICTAARAWLNQSFGLSTMVSETLWMWLCTEQSDRLLWSNEGSKDCQARIPMYIVQSVLFLATPYVTEWRKNLTEQSPQHATHLSHQSSGVTLYMVHVHVLESPCTWWCISHPRAFCMFPYNCWHWEILG